MYIEKIAKAIFALGLALWVTSVTANEPNWVSIAHGTVASVDYETTTLRRQGKRVLVWYRITYYQPQKSGKVLYDEVRARIDVDCATDTVDILAGHLYLKEKSVHHLPIRTYGNQVEPDSPVYHIEQAVCESQ